MTKLSIDQSRRKKLAERDKRRTQLRQNTYSWATPTAQVGDVRKVLAEKLHELATGEIVWNYPHFDQLLLEQGRVHGDEVRQVRGQPNRCHENCALLSWLNGPACQIATGFAYLHSMGRWVHHSWLLNNSAILETTDLQRDIYFGIVLGGLHWHNVVMIHIHSVLKEAIRRRITLSVN